MYICICIYVYLCIYIYIYIYIYIDVCVYIYLHTCIYTCMYTCVCIFSYTNVHVHIFIHTFIFTSFSFVRLLMRVYTLVHLPVCPCAYVEVCSHKICTTYRAPDLENFPLFKNARGCSVTLEACDAVFIPVKWWHFCHNDTGCLAVNYWWL